MAIEFAGQLSKQEFYAMQRLSMGKMRFFGMFLVICVVVAVASGGVSSFHWPADLPKVAIMLLILSLFFVGVPLSIARSWRKNPRLHESVSGSVADDGISWQSTYQQGRFPWNALLKWQSRGDLVLVYTSPRQVMFFPRHFFQTDVDWESFRKIVREHLRRG